MTIKDLQKEQSFELKTGGKRLKSIKQICENAVVNGVKTMCTTAEITSALETIQIILPLAGIWKFTEDKTILQFFPREGTCAEIKILLV